MKYYNIEVIVYEEDEYKRILETIEKDYKYASAYHDKDKKDDGKDKKAHYHIQIYGEHQKSIKSWAKLLNIEENKIEIVKYKPKAIRYLIHKDNKEKYQYEKNIIVSNFDIEEYFKDKQDETQELRLILEYINNSNYAKIKLSRILEFALDNNIWSTYRRNYSIIKDYINEKNMFTQEKINDIMKVS